MTSRTIDGPVGKLYVDDGGMGTGLTVVFVHSFAGSAKHWTAQLDFLRDMHRAVALDLRGHGSSDAPADGDYAVTSLAQDIAAAIEALALDDIILVGHSMGGAVAIAYAGAHPEHVAGLMLVGTPGRTPVAQRQKIMAALRADYERVSETHWKTLLESVEPEMRAQIRADMKNVPRAAAQTMIESVFAFDPLSALKNYPGPCLVVNTPHADTPNALHKQMPDLPFEMIEGTSHWMQMDKPDAFNEILADFIDQLEAGSAALPTWHGAAQSPQDHRQEY